MEKNRIRPVTAGKTMRMSYSRRKEVLEMPNLIEVQKNSYNWFLEEGLKEVFADISPIADYSGHLSLEFTDFTLCEKDVKYSIPECKERDATYAAPLRVKVRLYNKEADEINEHEIFMGDLPLMTETGTFVINGAERVIVSQLVRSPGIYYGIAHDKIGKELYSCTVIPNRGAWLEYETDSNDVFYVRVDRTRKVPITVLIRALGIGTNQEIIANLTAKTAEEVRSHMIQVMSNFLSTYADHLCTVAVSSISSSISAAIGNLALSMNHEISSQVVAAVTNYLKEMVNTSSKSDSASLSNFDDDYVEVNESSIKEFQIPESLVKPASENRVKISTKLFVTIFGTFILPILLQFSGIFVDLQQSAAEA